MINIVPQTSLTFLVTSTNGIYCRPNLWWRFGLA